MSPFSDEQFSKLWELTIRIDENTKNHTRELIAHSSDDIAKFALSKQATDSLHNRLDKVKIDLDESNELIKKDFDKSTGFQNRLLGAILLAAFLVPIVVNIWFRKP